MMINITFKYGNEIRTVEAKVGESLLDLAQRYNIPIIGACGGGGICGSCHVEIECANLKQPEGNEADLLECLPMYTPNTRLACQVMIEDNMDGMVVTVGV